MKKLFVLLLVLISMDSFAQLEIGGFYGYRVGGSVDIYYNNIWGEIGITDSESFGFDLDYQLRPGFSVNMSWYAQDTQMDFYGPFEKVSLGDIWLNYFLINGIYEKEIDKITPYFGLGIGMATAHPSSRELKSRAYFAADLQGGVKIALNERLSFKLRVAMLMPLQFGSGGLFCGTGSGCSVGVGASTTIIQGDFSGGIVVKLGEVGKTSHSPSPSSSPTW